MAEEKTRLEKPFDFNSPATEVKQKQAPTFVYSEIPGEYATDPAWSEYPGAKVGKSVAEPSSVVRINVTPEKRVSVLPLIVETPRLRLIPLGLDIVQVLRGRTLLEPGLFTYLDLDAGRQEVLDAWFVRALQNQHRGEAMHFVMTLKNSGEVIGHTAVVSIRPEHRRCEIAWTWVFAVHQCKGYGRESKLALYRFLTSCGFVRKQITVDERNSASIRSIEASGAKREGLMENAQILRDGTFRHTAIYAVGGDTSRQQTPAAVGATLAGQ